MALNAGLVDRPVGYKAHRRATPYLGGAAIALAVIAGRVVAHLPARVDDIVTALAAVLVIMGLIDDDRTLPALPRLLIEVACAVVAVIAGLRLTGSGVSALDVVLTVLVLVGMTNAMNLMDNLDGLAAGVTAAGAAGVAVLAGLGDHGATTADAASLVGACLAFLVFNARPASIFMGDAGSLFLGFLLAAVAIQAGNQLPEPTGLVVTFLIIALPVTDTATVVLSRLRHHRSPIIGGRDHLSHRLAGTGIGPGPAVAVLVGVEAGLAGLAVGVGRHAVPAWAALAAAAVILATVVAVASRTRVYGSGPAGLPRWLVWGAPAAVIVLGALTVPAALGALRARGPALAGESALESAVAAAHAGDLHTTSVDLTLAQADLARADRDLSGPLVSAGLAYPVLSSNLRAARSIVATGVALARSGNQLIAANQSPLQWIGSGAVNLDAVARARPGLQAAASVVDRAVVQVSGLSHAYLLGELDRAINRLAGALASAKTELDGAAGAATFLPPLLGADGPRHYFLAVQNPDESRGTGGLIGNWGLLVADQGRLRLQEFGRLEQLNRGGSQNRTLDAPAAYLARYGPFDPAHDWQNVNMSPDFPTVGGVIAGLFPQSGGVSVDGVVGVDPAGLKALLTLTGPIQVAGWPVPITAGNAESVTLYQAYLSYGSEDQRAAFLGEVARAAFTAFTRLQLSDPSQLVSVLGPALAGRHLQVYSTHSQEQAFLTRVGVAGALPPVVSDSATITTQNVAANKIDYYLHRSIDYRVMLTPRASASGTVGAPTSATADATLTVSLDDTAPSGGLPPSLIGPYSPQFRSGEEASFVSIYSPLRFRAATLNGAPATLSSDTEINRNVYSAFIDIGAGQTGTLSAGLDGPVALRPGGWYELDLPHQPVVYPDQVTVTIDLAPGWKVTGVRGAARDGPREVRAGFLQAADRAVWVQVGDAGG
jgi:UDP-N-acetylmuramyl pentapeptide phosphotransferase/UDP-N-acetylglucosamine-1-phosphate transferase